MRKVSKCKCGSRKSQYANLCKKCSAERNTALKAENHKILETGVCPKCGSKLRRNSSLTGWFQCEQVGAETHRARPQDKPCSFQMFV